LAAHIDDFLTDLANANRPPNTVSANRGDLNAFAAHHGGDIAGLTPHRAARRPQQLALLRLYLARFGCTVGPVFRASINGRGARLLDTSAMARAARATATCATSRRSAQRLPVGTYLVTCPVTQKALSLLGKGLELRKLVAGAGFEPATSGL